MDGHSDMFSPKMKETIGYLFRSLPKEIEVEITKSDVENGLKGSPTHCPVALALRREFPNKEISVSISALYLGNTEYWGGFRLTKQIQNFDRDGKFELGKYKLTKINRFSF